MPAPALRAGRKLPRGGLLARFGADIALPDLLMALASCDRRRPQPGVEPIFNFRGG
jgi:hypothetical protein